MINAMPRIAIAMHDFDAAVTTFRDGLGMPVLDFSDRTVPDLGAHVGMCQPPGGSNVELMAPADPAKPLSQALQKFLDRRGEGIYALMLEAADPDAEAEELVGRGLDVLPLMVGAGGRDIHPRSTSGVLIRVYPDNSVANDGGHQGVAPALSGITRAVLATDDLAAATAAYGQGLGLALDSPGPNGAAGATGEPSPAGEPTTDPERGVASVLVRPPKGGVVELVSVVDASRPFAAAVQEHLKERGSGLFALVLHVGEGSMEAAGQILAERGVASAPTGASGESGLELSLFGARFLLQ